MPRIGIFVSYTSVFRFSNSPLARDLLIVKLNNFNIFLFGLIISYSRCMLILNNYRPTYNLWPPLASNLWVSSTCFAAKRTFFYLFLLVEVFYWSMTFSFHLLLALIAFGRLPL